MCRVHFEAVRETAAAFYAPEVIESWSHEPDDDQRERFRRAIAGAAELFVVAEHAGEVVGFGSIAPSSAELRAVYVEPRVGRRAVGGAIVRELERLALAHGLPALRLEAALNAERFCLRHGYAVVARGTQPERRCGDGLLER